MTDTDQLKTMISGLASKTIYGQLEPLMPEIDRKIKEGVPRSDIYKVITAQGIEISEGTFYNYLHRYRKRNMTTEKKPKQGGEKKTPELQNGNSDQDITESHAQNDQSNEVYQASEPSLDDMLKNEKSREDFTNQFMQHRPIRRKKP